MADLSPKPLNYSQEIYCLNCCVLAKEADEKGDMEFPGILPALTFEVQVFNNMPVSVPVCGMHLRTNNSSKLVTS